MSYPNYRLTRTEGETGETFRLDGIATVCSLETNTRRGITFDGRSRGPSSMAI